MKGKKHEMDSLCSLEDSSVDAVPPNYSRQEFATALIGIACLVLAKDPVEREAILFSRDQRALKLTAGIMSAIESFMPPETSVTIH